MIESYHIILKGISDDYIYEAAKLCLSECEYFPKPKEILKRVPKKVNDDLEGVNFKIAERMRCQNQGCLRVDMCIKEPVDDPASKYLCRDCYSGLTLQERNQRMRDILHMIKDKDFKPTWVAPNPET